MCTSQFLDLNKLQKSNILLTYRRNFSNNTARNNQCHILLLHHGPIVTENEIKDETGLLKPAENIMRKFSNCSRSHYVLIDFAKKFSDNNISQENEKEVTPIVRQEKILKKVLSIKDSNLSPATSQQEFFQGNIAYDSNQINKKMFSYIFENICKTQTRNMSSNKSLLHLPLLKNYMKMINYPNKLSSDSVVLNVTVNIPLSDLQSARQSKKPRVSKNSNDTLKSQSIFRNAVKSQTKYATNLVTPIYSSRAKVKPTKDEVKIKKLVSRIGKNKETVNFSQVTEKNNKNLNKSYVPFKSNMSLKSSKLQSKIKNKSGVTSISIKKKPKKSSINDKLKKCMTLIQYEKVKNLKNHVKKMVLPAQNEHDLQCSSTEHNKKIEILKKKNINFEPKQDNVSELGSQITKQKKEGSKISDTVDEIKIKKSVSCLGKEKETINFRQVADSTQKLQQIVPAKISQKKLSHNLIKKIDDNKDTKFGETKNLTGNLDDPLEILNYKKKIPEKEKYSLNDLTKNNFKENKTFLKKYELNRNKEPETKRDYVVKDKNNKFLDWRSQCTNINEPDDEFSCSLKEMKRPNNNHVFGRGGIIKKTTKLIPANETTDSISIKSKKLEEKKQSHVLQQKINYPLTEQRIGITQEINERKPDKGQFNGLDLQNLHNLKDDIMKKNVQLSRVTITKVTPVKANVGNISIKPKEWEENQQTYMLQHKSTCPPNDKRIEQYLETSDRKSVKKQCKEMNRSNSQISKDSLKKNELRSENNTKLTPIKESMESISKIPKEWEEKKQYNVSQQKSTCPQTEKKIDQSLETNERKPDTRQFKKCDLSNSQNSKDSLKQNGLLGSETITSLIKIKPVKPNTVTISTSSKGLEENKQSQLSQPKKIYPLTEQRTEIPLDTSARKLDKHFNVWDLSNCQIMKNLTQQNFQFNKRDTKQNNVNKGMTFLASENKRISKKDIWNQNTLNEERPGNLKGLNIQTQKRSIDSTNCEGVYKKLKKFLTQEGTQKNKKQHITISDHKKSNITLNTEMETKERIEPKCSLDQSTDIETLTSLKSSIMAKHHQWQQTVKFPQTKALKDKKPSTIWYTTKHNEMQQSKNTEELIAIKTAEFCKILVELVKLFAISAMKDIERSNKDQMDDNYQRRRHY